MVEGGSVAAEEEETGREWSLGRGTRWRERAAARRGAVESIAGVEEVVEGEGEGEGEFGGGGWWGRGRVVMGVGWLAGGEKTGRQHQHSHREASRRDVLARLGASGVLQQSIRKHLQTDRQTIRDLISALLLRFAVNLALPGAGPSCNMYIKRPGTALSAGCPFSSRPLPPGSRPF